MTTDATVRNFFSSSAYAVVGASSNPAKFGHKVFAWYTQRPGLPVHPVNPGSPSISVSGTPYPTIPSLASLPDPKNTSVSVITPPPATLEVLRQARDLGIPAVWLQPGTWDDEVIKFARGQTADGYKGAVVAGDGGGGHGGWCILVDGDDGLKSVGKL